MRDISFYFTAVSKEMHLKPQHISDLREKVKKRAKDAAEMKNDSDEHAKVSSRFKRSNKIEVHVRRSMSLILSGLPLMRSSVMNSLKITIAEAFGRDSSFTASWLLGVMQEKSSPLQREKLQIIYI